MVVSEQFPMFRLATLLARQLSSPIATRIKEYAKSHPRFGRSVCMRSGRAAAAAELRFKLWTLQARGAAAALPSLSDARALEAGADLLGEMILFALGAAIVTFEYNRQAMKQEAKADAEQSGWLAVQLQVEELQAELQEQQRDLDRLFGTLRALAEPEADSEPKPSPTPEPLNEPEPEPNAGLHSEPKPSPQPSNESKPEPIEGLDNTPSRVPAPPDFCPCPELSTDPPL